MAQFGYCEARAAHTNQRDVIEIKKTIISALSVLIINAHTVSTLMFGEVKNMNADAKNRTCIFKHNYL